VELNISTVDFSICIDSMYTLNLLRHGLKAQLQS